MTDPAKAAVALKAVTAARVERDRLKNQMIRAQKELDEAIERAITLGVGALQIAPAAGLTATRAQQTVDAYRARHRR